MSMKEPKKIFDFDARLMLERLLKQRFRTKDIAKYLGKSERGVSLEIQRSTDGKGREFYSAKEAQEKSDLRIRRRSTFRSLDVPQLSLLEEPFEFPVKTESLEENQHQLDSINQQIDIILDVIKDMQQQINKILESKNDSI